MEPASRKPPKLVTMPRATCRSFFTPLRRCNRHASGARELQISVPGAQEIVDWWNAGRRRHRRRVAALGVALLVALLTIIGAVHSDHHALAAVGEDGQWLRAAGDYASTRYSPLAQITAANVRQLRPAWSFSTGVARGHEAAPLVVGDTMYVVTPYPNVLYALDLRAGGGTVRWKYEPKPAAAAQGVACCDVVNRGAATVWGWISYDAELDLVYYGTGNPGPWNPEQRPGDNRWTSAIFARRPSTGEAVWAYQLSPHDLHDYDGIDEQILLDLDIKGRRRKALVRPDRNGYVYVMDRATGEVLSATPFAHVNTSKGVDLATGQLSLNDEKTPVLGKVVRDICPAAPGAKDWQPSAWSPRTGLLYVPHQNLCMDVESVETGYIAGTPFVGMNVRMYSGPGGHRGEVTAWDPVNARAAWKLKEPFPVWSGALATAGDVVFYGTMDRWFKAVDAKTGELLWRFQTASGIIGQPITCRGPDGKQYVAVLDGVGGWAGAIVSGDLDPRDTGAALGFVNAMRDLPAHTPKGGTLWVFALP